MNIDLGMDVLTSDGHKLGAVRKLVFDPASKQILSLIVGGGLIGNHDHIVDMSMISGEASNALTLDLSEKDAAQLPTFVTRQFVEVPRGDYDSLPYVQPSASGGLYLYGAPFVGRGYEGRSDSFYDAAPTNPPILQNQSNLEETNTLISAGTDVVGSDEKKIGTVEEVYVNTDGEVTGFLIKKGWIFTHDIRIPMDWVREVDGDKIHLTLTGSEAETKAHDATAATS
ncbi:MAG TPA: PRC-barrel domain-containing protein [Thermomicrobiales bacterium]|nr:PRC-barrel domain-containing protein [Thermomicrobiales bacterium]HQZ88983.1 PRC-barrel domain-containing protein [Thermomicrobiales bacterium]HRA31453.1 PRC-barrel domain-containing protein [Thermomicrobiales bacterium]